MSKISRVGQTESYKITSDWLSEFATNITKNANIIETLGRNSREKFATIEDKMEDLKKRVGFDEISNLKKESSLSQLDSQCGCSECDACGKKKMLRGKLRAIINHAKNLIKERPEIGYMQVIDSCRSLPIYQDIVNNLKHKNFSSKIKSMLEGKNDYNENYDFEHIPHTEMHQFDFSDDLKAPYIRD